MVLVERRRGGGRASDGGRRGRLYDGSDETALPFRYVGGFGSPAGGRAYIGARCGGEAGVVGEDEFGAGGAVLGLDVGPAGGEVGGHLERVGVCRIRRDPKEWRRRRRVQEESRAAEESMTMPLLTRLGAG